MPLWNKDPKLPQGIMGAAQITTDGTYTTSGGMLCSFSAVLDPKRRYKISSGHAMTGDANAGSGTPPSDVLFLFLLYSTTGAVTLTSAELTSDTVTDDGLATEGDDTPYRAMSFQFLLPAGWSGTYYFGASIKVITYAAGSVGDTFMGASGFKFQMVLEDIGAA